MYSGGHFLKVCRIQCATPVRNKRDLNAGFVEARANLHCGETKGQFFPFFPRNMYNFFAAAAPRKEQKASAGVSQNIGEA